MADRKGKGPGAWQTSRSYQVALDKIIEARKVAGLSQRDLAEALGKPRSWVSKYETKERRLDIIEFIAVARQLGLKETDLLRTIAADLPKRIEI